MCEVLAARWSEPAPLMTMLPWAEKMEYYGLGSFGWGVAWREGRSVSCYRYPGRLSEDREARKVLAGVSSDRFLFHFRRPTRLGTVSFADTQPFLGAGGRFAFCHNGYLANEARFREGFHARLQGEADSEVGFLMFTDLLSSGMPAQAAMEHVHTRLTGEGNANLGYLGAGGELVVFGAHRSNRVYRFQVDGAELGATDLHSPDDSLFRLIFPSAKGRRLVSGAETIAEAEVAT